VKRQPSLRGGGVDAFGERDELDAALVEGFDLGDEVFQRAPEPIEAPDDEGIALAEVLQACVELRTARCLARDRIGVRLLAFCRVYRAPLKVQFLFAERYAGISGVMGGKPQVAGRLHMGIAYNRVNICVECSRTSGEGWMRIGH